MQTDVDKNAEKGSSQGGFHPAVGGGGNPNEGHGKNVGLVKAPIVSMNATSGLSGKKKTDYQIFNKIDIDDSKDDAPNEFPFDDLNAAGDGFFVPATDAESTDSIVEKMHRAVDGMRKRYAEVERTADGDRILDMVCIEERKKNDDGTIQLEADGKPIVGANFQQHPKLIYSRNYVVRAVAKDDEYSEGNKVPGDGVLVIRVY